MEACQSAFAIVTALKKELAKTSISPECIQLVSDTSRESAMALMKAKGYIDELIPRGGAGLIRAVIENAIVPVIQTGTGIVHIYIDKDADLAKAIKLVENAKMSRPSVCNAKAVKLSETLGAKAVTNREVFEQANVIFLGVKPNQIQALLEENKNILERRESILLISMAAGVTLEQLESMTDTRHRWIRMMSNISLEVAEGVISFSLEGNVTTSDKEGFVRLLQSAGLLVELPESQIDAATALAGCGPAFVYIFIEVLAEAGVSMGLSREVALKLATQTVKGSAIMVGETKEHPAVLKEKVCSPGGSTIAGVILLEQTGFRSSVIQAARRAKERTEELGQ